MNLMFSSLQGAVKSSQRQVLKRTLLQTAILSNMRMVDFVVKCGFLENKAPVVSFLLSLFKSCFMLLLEHICDTQMPPDA